MIPAVLNNPIPASARKISGSVLKLVAVVTMLIDHTAAALIQPLLMNGNYFFMPSWDAGARLYYLCRGIGRIAFPLYCFLLVEGLAHTKSRLRYLLSLLGFAVLSELPFDIALIANDEMSNTFDIPALLLSNQARLVMYQNVFFTLLIGLAVIWVIDTVFTLAARKIDAYAKKNGPGNGYYALPYYIAAAVISAVAFLAGTLLADFLHTDYDHRGLILIVCLYLLRHARLVACATGYLYFSHYVYNEVWSFPGFLMMLLYNDRRGFISGGWKYAFYLFYPVHLIVLYVLRCMLI